MSPRSAGKQPRQLTEEEHQTLAAYTPKVIPAHRWALVRECPATNRTYRGPAGPSYIRPSVANADPYRDQPGREWRSGWEWLAAPELAPMVPWLLIATADARPGTVTRIEYAPEAQAAEDAEHARLWSDWTTTGGGGHQNVSTFAAQWWAERDAR